jgi:hypothetical protein
MRNICSERFLILVPEAASFLRHIPQPHSSKQADDNNTTTWSTMGGKFTTTKTGFVIFSLPEFNLKKQI